MITVSACLIVKDEEKVLSRCLDSIKDLVEEIIIVDTGSKDRTKEIARRYTDKIYDFLWNGDFSAARNASFEKATMEYIYAVDADEVIDEENRKKFLQLKEALLPEIEIVQMYYANQLEYNTTYNFDREYRPKLYKRLRTFCWMDPLHEAVRLEPVVWDSDIEICHKPLKSHAARDFKLYQTAIARDGVLSPKVRMMYARELFIAGQEEDFLEALSYFAGELQRGDISEEDLKLCQCVIARAARLSGDDGLFFKTILKQTVTGQPSSELCYEIGEYYYGRCEYAEAALWYDSAATGAEAILYIKYQSEYPENRLKECMGRI